jgi:hypothetical protein
VDRAGTYNDNQAIIRSVEDVYDLATRVKNSARRIISDGHLLLKEDWRKNDSTGLDPEIICGICHNRSIYILAKGGTAAQQGRLD